MTGFRVALGGAQSLYAAAIPGFAPDLSVFGKVIGGGMPLAAFGGKRAVMELLAPLGPVYQAGTLSGNPVAVAAGLATLKLIQAPGFFNRLTATTRSLCEGLTRYAQENHVPFSAMAVGGMFGLYFRETPPASYAEVMQCDKEAFNRFFHAMLAEGVYLAPSAYEAGFVSDAHEPEVIERTIAAAKKIFVGGNH
jgi:glutamate-1-semialdehyde 2,1-aminomutase